MLKKGKLCLFLIFAISINLILLEDIFSQEGTFDNLEIEYFISVKENNYENFSVRIKISKIVSDVIFLKMTDNYGKLKKPEDLISDFEILKPKDTNNKIEKINDFIWKIPIDKNSEILIDYSVKTQFPYSTLNLVRLPYRTKEFLYFPVASTLIYPELKFFNEKNTAIEKISLIFDLPTNWIAATSWGTNSDTIRVNPTNLKSFNTGLIGLGDYRTYSFEIDDLTVQTAYLNSYKEIEDEFNTAIKESFKSGYKIFGFIPLARYFNLFNFVLKHPGQGSGNALGWSSCLHFGPIEKNADFTEKKSHIFHEIFHFWNGTGEPPLSRAKNDYSLIWFSEGITRYYQYKNMLSSAVIQEKKFLEFLSEDFEKVYHNSLRDDDIYSISEKYYNNKEAFDLTYKKGCCIAFALDLRIKMLSSGEKCFGDVLRMLLEKNDFRKNARAYDKNDIKMVISDILGEKYFDEFEKLCGSNFVDQFKSILENSDLNIKKSKGHELYFGIRNYGPPGKEVKVLSVDRDSPAFNAGLKSGDIILSIEGQKVDSTSSIKEIVKNYSKDESLKLIVKRNGKKLSINTPWFSQITKFKIVKK